MDNQDVSLSNQFKFRKTDQDIFTDLMSFKVREVLLVANHYDAYSVIREGRFFDKIFGDYLQLNLYTAPRISSVSNFDEARLLMNSRSFDMVIIMAGLDKETPLVIAHQIKLIYPALPILLLVNNNRDLKYFDQRTQNINNIQRVFVWNGDSRVFLAMIKSVEDQMNVDADVRIGDVRVILLVEDSKRYYTRYLPVLYSILMEQTQLLVSEENSDALHRVLKVRVRPKILLATDYEEAIRIVQTYRDNLICVISDVKFPKEGALNALAGLELVNDIKRHIRIPILLQSSKSDNKQIADDLEVDFLDKNSDTLAQDLTQFINNKLGFGTFLFRNERGKVFMSASNLKEFEHCIKVVPPESILFHAKRNGISTWLMARGEIRLAKRLRPYKIEDFDSTTMLRNAILNVFEEVRFERIKGRVIEFDPSLVGSERLILRAGNGSFGGKGRGIAFLSYFIENVDRDRQYRELDIKVPSTIIIGADEYSLFIERNHLLTRAYLEKDYEEIKRMFSEAHLSTDIEETLKMYLKSINKPLAIRSSGLFEDSLLQPFAGVYSTFLVPNNSADFNKRFEELSLAIKLVYASIFNEKSIAYFEAVNYKIEEEKMAVIVQELVGQRVGNHFYPNVSGVAQSINYYPFSYMKPSDGFSVMAVGLGRYVVGGEKSWRYCPKYPKLELNAISEQIQNTQNHFYALNLEDVSSDLLKNGEDAFVVKLDIKELEEDGNINGCAEVYDYNNDRLISDFELRGPRLINFAGILKYDSIPLAATLNHLLQQLENAFGAPVEIEYSLNFDDSSQNATLYLLQVKPLIKNENIGKVSLSGIASHKLLISSNKGMGNGEITDVKMVVFTKLEMFDRTKTIEMAKEVELINRYLREQKEEYILIGPGRWGTRDRFTGIPVFWSQISNAKVIIEHGIKDYPLDASLGSHFFHNVTSMNVGYFSIHHNVEGDKINFDLLNKQKTVWESIYFKCVEFENALTILMDGETQKAVVAIK